MALRFMDGFDHYTTADAARYKWTIVNSGSAFNVAGRRSGSLAASFPYSNGSYISKSLDAQTTYVVGGAYYFTLNGGTYDFFKFIDSNNALQVNLKLNASNQILAYRGNYTLLGTSSISIPLNTWVYIEAKLFVNDSTGTLDVMVNGTNVLTYTGDTKDSSLANIQTIQVGNFGTDARPDFYLDDFYICDGTGSTNNTFLGDVRIDTLYPTGAGTTTQFTGVGDVSNLYANIDDAVIDTTTYNYAGTAGNKDTFATGNLSSLSATVFGVQTNLCACKDDAGSRTMADMIRSASTDYQGGTTHVLFDSYSDLRTVHETNPATSTAWTETTVNAAEFGYKIVA